jgi:hypothetical protein
MFSRYFSKSFNNLDTITEKLWEEIDGLAQVKSTYDLDDVCFSATRYIMLYSASINFKSIDFDY